MTPKHYLCNHHMGRSGKDLSYTIEEGGESPSGADTFNNKFGFVISL